MMFKASDLFYFLPEIILVCTVLVLFVVDLSNIPKKRTTWVALAGVFLAAVVNVYFESQNYNVSIFSHLLSIDPMGTIFKHIFFAATIMALITSYLSEELPQKYLGEYNILLVGITIGLGIMASANDLLTMFLGIEMVSILSYSLSGFRLKDKKASEAALKYVVYGGAASGVMLFGMSLFYGLFGTTQFNVIQENLIPFIIDSKTNAAINGSYFEITLMVAFAMVFAGVGYKISIVPFHMWTPDVYEGSPMPVTSFFSIGPKAAGFALLIRFVVGCFVMSDTFYFQPEVINGFVSDAGGKMNLLFDLPVPALLGILAALTMTIGNFAALTQTNIKRLLAYSSIAHAGYTLMAYVVLSKESLAAVIFYTISYYLMNFGVFVIAQAVRDNTGGENISDFQGLGKDNIFLAAGMTIFAFSLTGLPPFLGFFAKWNLFASVLSHENSWYYALGLVGVLNSAVSLYYYAKLGLIVWKPKKVGYNYKTIKPVYSLMAMLFAFPVLFGLLFIDPIMNTVQGDLVINRSTFANEKEEVRSVLTKVGQWESQVVEVPQETSPQTPVKTPLKTPAK